VHQGKVLVRDARPDELAPVADVLLKAYTEYSKVMPTEAWEEYRRDIVDVRGRLSASQLIVAQQGATGAIVGSVTYYPAAEAEKDGWPKGWAYVRLLGVLPEARGRGIGRILMEDCLRRCRAEDCEALALHTISFMQAARALYGRMGFQRLLERDYYPAPGVVVMAYQMPVAARK
jgi:ribosomal protein S18 acetylase RimI-like enzyme